MTTAGRLPAEYIFHAAATELKEIDEGLVGTVGGISDAFRDVFRKCKVLNVHTIFTPLLGTGNGGVTIEDSLNALLDAMNAEQVWNFDLRFVLVDFTSRIDPVSLERLLESKLLTPHNSTKVAPEKKSFLARYLGGS